MNLSEFILCAKNGIRPSNCKLIGFSEACYNDCSIDEMISAIKSRSADKMECERWGITPTEWREAIKSTLSFSMFMYAFDNNLE